MLHDPNHESPVAAADEIILKPIEKDTLRRLAADVAKAAAAPVNGERARLWRKLNDRESERPMVWINQIPWHEMNIDNELTVTCETPWARQQERGLRTLLYLWRHMPGDMIVDEFLACPLAIKTTGFGIQEDVDIRKTDNQNSVVSRHFRVQISDFKDLEKIKMPVVTHDEAETERRYRTMCSVYDGILPVRKVGQKHIWFTPWDFLIRWWGVEEAMLDLYERPELVHAAVERMTDAWMTELDQFDKLNVLSLDNSNTGIGSGGYGYTRDLPGKDLDAGHVRPRNMWGCSNAQIFSEVSPDMHWEFAIKHDLRWLERWGLNYYGCCEPLDRKAHLLERIPRLRKVSVTPWCDSKRAVENLGGRYVLSRKPNPAILAENDFSPERARKQLTEFLDAARGCHVELIMKDISTVRYDPKRLWEWARIATELATG